MANKETYKLYAGKLQNIPSDIKYSFYNSENQYILLYTDKKPIEGDFREVPKELLKELTPAENSWIASAKLAINAQYVKENSAKFTEALNEFADELEKQLKIEKENVDRIKDEQ